MAIECRGALVVGHACRALNEMKAVLLMALGQAAVAGVNVLYQLAALDGMNLRIVVAYRCLFATAFLCPLAFFVERRKMPKLTWTMVGQAFLSGLLGGSLAQNLFLEGIALTSATFATAVSNLAPAITFVLAVCFRLESLSLRTTAGKAMVMGTIIGVGGAMVLTFYKGIEINLWTTNIHLYHTSSHDHGHKLAILPSNSRDRILGLLACVGGCICLAFWLILQAKMSQRNSCFYTSTALMNLMAFVQATVFALVVDHDWDHWKLGWNIRLLTVAYTGVFGSGLIVVLMAWCVHLKGPLFVSIFSPFLLFLVVLSGWLFLDEKLYMGSLLGGLLIVIGLYVVLLGKAEEMKRINQLAPSSRSDFEAHNSTEKTSTLSSSPLPRSGYDGDNHQVVDIENNNNNNNTTLRD